MTAIAHPGRSARPHEMRLAALEGPLAAGLGLRLIDDDAPERGVWFTVSDLSGDGFGGVAPAALGAAMEVAAHLAIGATLAADEHALTHATACQIAHAVRAGERVEVTATLYRPEGHTAYVYADARAGGVVVASGQIVKTVSRTA